jgi:hypothetical protein
MLFPWKEFLMGWIKENSKTQGKGQTRKIGKKKQQQQGKSGGKKKKRF